MHTKINPFRRFGRWLCVALIAPVLLIGLSSCAVLDMGNPQSPSIKIERVIPKQIGSTVQKLEIELLIQNPNRFDLQIQGLDFTAFVNGERFAKGQSEQFTIVPALGEALLEIQVAVGLADLFSQAAKLISEPETAPLVYGVTGTVTLENWPSAIPFNVDGEYASPLQ